MALAVLCFLFSACCNDSILHNEEEEKQESGVRFNVTYADPTDSTTTTVDKVDQWVYDATSGTLINTHTYDTPTQLADQTLDLAYGEYLVVTTYNLTSPFTSSTDSATGELFFSLADPAASPDHAFFGVSRFRYSGYDVSMVDKRVTRILAELSVEMEGVPEGATLSTRVTNVAEGIYPLRQNSDGSYGVPSSGNPVEVSLPDATAASDGTLSTPVVRLMPTVADNTYSYIHFTLTLADGTQMECDAEAPKMYSAGKYIVKLDYTDFATFIHLSPISIDDWTEGWIISGSIFNPD